MIFLIFRFIGLIGFIGFIAFIGLIGFIGFILSTKGQHVAELVQRTQQLVPDVQQVGAQRRGHALQILLVVLYAVLQCGQRVE